MKILKVCPYDIFRPGGVQNHIIQLARTLRKKGHEVKIIAPNTPNGSKDEIEDLKLIGTSKKVNFSKTQIDVNFLTLKQMKELKDYLKKEEFDIIHFHTMWNPFIPMQLRLVSNKRSKHINTFHDTPPDTFIAQLAGKTVIPLLGFILRKFFLEHAISVTKSQSEFIGKFYKKNLSIIPNGVDLSEMDPSSKPLDKFDDDMFNILFFGRLEERKGVMYLVKAFHKLKQKYKDLRLIIGGKGEQSDLVKQYVQKHELKDIEMLGFVSDKDKPRVFSSADIYCSPAIYGESFGIVLIEAMAMGKPIVGYANSGYKNVLTEPWDRFLAEPKNVDELVARLEELYLDKELRKKMSNWGLQEVKKYSWNRLSEDILKVYDKVLGK